MLHTSVETWRGDRRLRVARMGEGTPVVLLHGYPENLQLWSELAPRLATHHEVLAFDWPGMGYSDSWPGGATPSHMADRLLELLDGWRLPRVTLVAMDMGSQPALVFAAKHPERVQHLVVMNALLFGDLPTSWEIRVLRRFGWNRRILRLLPSLVFRRAERTFLPRGTRLPAELRRDLWEAFRRPEVRRFISKMCAGYQGRLDSLPDLYTRIRCPTLALWGESDRHFPPIHAERLDAVVESARPEILSGAEHWMAWYLADEVASRILDFTRSRPGQPER